MNLEKVTYADDIKEISQLAYYKCKELKITELPDTVTTIGIGKESGSSFFDCAKLSLTKLPDSLVTLGGSSFANTSIAITEIKGAVNLDATSAFKGCNSIKTLTIEEGCKKIGYWTFAFCDGLTDIDLPSTIETIGASFNYSNNIKTLAIHATTPPAMGSALPSACTIYVPDDSLEAYKAATGWSNFATQIKPLSEK